MALPRITQKEMTEREQRELKTLLDRARIAHGRVLTNSETNSIKKEYIDKLMVEREAEAKKARQLKKKQAYKPDPEASFSWSANTSTRGSHASLSRFFLKPMEYRILYQWLYHQFWDRISPVHKEEAGRKGKSTNSGGNRNY